MTIRGINGDRLRESIREFGLLQKAVDALRSQKEALEANVSALIKDVDDKEKFRVKCLDIINNLESKINEGKEVLKKIIDDINRHGLEYWYFESFLAMLLTSPSIDESLEDLATHILMAAKVVKSTIDFPFDKRRWLFVNTVLGSYLHCYRCDNCDASFIVNKKARSQFLGLACPVCGSTFYIKADESFLDAMLGSGNSADASKTPEEKK